MEVQEDSIDIAHLKRLALGLVEEEPQLHFSSRREIVDGGKDQLGDLRQAWEEKDVPEAQSVGAYVGDVGTAVKPLIHAGDKFPRLPPPYCWPYKMSLTQRSSQPELANKIPGSRDGRMTPENSAPGDTQPVSPSVFESMFKKSKSPLESTDIQQEGYGNIGDGVTQLTLMEGDTGHVDLLDGFGEIQAGDHSENDADFGSNFGNSSPAHFQPNQFPESQRFIHKTPATDKRRKLRDDTTAETPSLPKNPLARDGGHSGGQTMALSQVFKGTQAPSSPFVNGLTSDPLSDRPSPNIPIQNRPVAASASSPFLGPSSGLRPIAEPQTNYVSMKESQDARQKLTDQRKTRSASNMNDDDLSEDEFDNGDTVIQRCVRQKMFHEEARKQLVNVTAPARPQSKGGGKKGSISKASQDKDSGNDNDQIDTVMVSDDNVEDDLPPTDNGASSEEETEQEEDLDRPLNQRAGKDTSSSEEDKENFDDPLANGPDTTARAHGALSEVLELNESPSVRRNIFANVLPLATQQSTTTGDENEQLPQRGSQDINVVDSQPDRQNSPGGQSSTLPTNLQTSSLATKYFAPKSQLEKGCDERRKSSSPVIRSPMPSSPPMHEEEYREQGHVGQSFTNNNGASLRQVGGTSPECPNENSTRSNALEKSRQSKKDTDGSGIQQQASAQEDRTQIHSSISRVYETPIHNRPLGQSFLNTVPETSPGSQRDNAPFAVTGGAFSSEKISSAALPPDNDNDMLPPPYTEGKDLHGAALQRSVVAKRLSQGAAILSSPSGRQRRTLTEIASDPPPDDPFGDVDMDVGLVTKDDNEFQSIVGASPTRPQKRRRGNDGNDIVTTRMVPIKPPCEPTPPIRLGRTTEGRDKSPSPGPDELDFQEMPVLRRSRPVSRSENVWDIETSPKKQPVRAQPLRRSQSSGYVSSRRSRHSEPTNRPRGTSVAKEVAILNRKSLQATSTKKAGSVSRDSPDPIQEDSPMRDQDADQDVQTCSIPLNDTIVAPNHIFACYNGRKRAYYPAVCLGAANSIGKTGYVIKFEDTDADEVDVHAVKRLELRIGDAVKVDLPSIPKVPHVIRGLKDKIDPDSASRSHPDDPELPHCMTDVYGYSTVLVAPKQRKSLPNGARAKLLSVPISKIYFDTVLWSQFKGRKFTHSPETRSWFSRPGTPITRHATPLPPSARTTPFPNAGLFAGMVFAISYRGKEEVKSRVTDLIEQNGGRVLQDGFQELFVFPTNVPPVTPKKGRPKKPESQFQLTPKAENIGFAALIADQHSRRAKYMQALALNIPCLSGRWVEDCIKHNNVLDWQHYLLPAGESKLLHGAIRSRVMDYSPASTARFVETTAARPKLLNGQSVLLVMGKGKAEEKRKAYVFLTYALGAARVERVLDLKAAKATLSQAPRGRGMSQGPGSQESQSRSGWDWVYVDDQEEAIAKATLPGVHNPKAAKSEAQTGKKRKRSERAQSIGSVYAGTEEHYTRLVGNEFVCQSLILGKLFEE